MILPGVRTAGLMGGGARHGRGTAPEVETGLDFAGEKSARVVNPPVAAPPVNYCKDRSYASSEGVSSTGTPCRLSQSVVETPQTAGRWQSPSMPGPLSEPVLPLVPRCESASTTGWSPANGFGVTRWLPVRLSHKSWNP